MKRSRIATVLIGLLAVFALAALTTIRADGSRSSAKHLTFADVAPIFYRSCAECHRPGETAPMSLLNYKQARPWARSIREKVVSRQMPPWHANPDHGEFKNDRRLTRAEIDKIVAWVDGGAREGDPRAVPPAPEFYDGWAIGKPDLIIPMPEEFTVEAEGPDEYQYFEVDPGFTEDKYVQMAEARPGNRAVVHHIIAFVRPPDKNGDSRSQMTKEEIEQWREKMERESLFYRDGFLLRTKADVPVYDDGCALPGGGSGSLRDGTGASLFNELGMLLCGFAPGMNPVAWAPGAVKKIPAGSRIIFQMHYSKTVGSTQKDRSMLGLVFAKQTPERRIITRPVMNNYFRIPPGAEKHRVTACWTADEGVELMSIMPHMHMRGRAMRISAFYPNGRSDILLDVPDYDFAWQTFYNFKRPIAIPRGTKFLVEGVFDNSSKNRFNPDPGQAVRHGEPTYDEMMIAFIEYAVDLKAVD